MMASLADAMVRYPRWKSMAGIFNDKDSGGPVSPARAEYRERLNRTPCPNCGATDLVYRWVTSPHGPVDGTWFCFCGRTEVDD